MHILPCMGLIFCVKFQRTPLKFRTKFWPHTPQNMHFTNLYFCMWFRVSFKCDVIDLRETVPRYAKIIGCDFSILSMYQVRWIEFLLSIDTVAVLSISHSFRRYQVPPNLQCKSYQIPNLKRFSSRLAVVSALSIEARCQVENDVVVAALTCDAPTTSEWSPILLPTIMGLILEVWRKAMLQWSRYTGLQCCLKVIPWQHCTRLTLFPRQFQAVDVKRFRNRIHYMRLMAFTMKRFRLGCHLPFSRWLGARLL